MINTGEQAKNRHCAVPPPPCRRCRSNRFDSTVDTTCPTNIYIPHHLPHMQSGSGGKKRATAKKKSISNLIAKLSVIVCVCFAAKFIVQKYIWCMEIALVRSKHSHIFNFLHIFCALSRATHRPRIHRIAKHRDRLNEIKFIDK